MLKYIIKQKESYMPQYTNFDMKEVLVQRAGVADNNIYSLKDDSFAPQGDYIVAMYDEDNNFIGCNKGSSVAHINSDDFPGYKKPFLSSKFKGTIIFVKKNIIDLDLRVVMHPKYEFIKTQEKGVITDHPILGNITLRAGVTLPDLAKLLNEIGVLRKKGDNQGICMTYDNFLVLMQMVLDKTFKTNSFDPKAIDGTIYHGESGDLVNLMEVPSNDNFKKYFVQAFNNTAKRMNMACIQISEVSNRF